MLHFLSRSFRIAAGAVILVLALPALASFHTFRINEIYSNFDGTIQFIELKEASGASGQNFLRGLTLTSGSGANQKSFAFTNDLASFNTGGKSVLIATQGFAALGLVTPDYIVPNNFLAQPSGTINYANVDFVEYFQLPFDGTTSVNRNAVAQQNSPTNFAGQSATIPAPAQNGGVTEFFNTILAQFFLTADPTEAASIDHGGSGPGWVRTGMSFKPGGPTSVCRFYGNARANPATGGIFGPNSHFYTADAAECAGLKGAQNPNAKSWFFESNDFNTTPAVNGTCASGLVPIYRAYNNGFAKGIDSNHRITSKLTDYQKQINEGWAGEGVVMCAQP